MFRINILELIPEDTQEQALDALVNFVSDQAKKTLGEEIGNKLKLLRSDAGFKRQFNQGLQRAVERFIQEYELQDEDLVAAIATDPSFFENDDVQQALLAMIKRPGSYLAEEQAALILTFDEILPERRNRERVDQAVTYLLRCLAEELWHLPELQPIYALQFQRITAESAKETVTLQRAQLQATQNLGTDVRQALLQLTDAMEQRLLVAPEAPALPRERPIHNLPRPDYLRFVGREKELTWVRERLSPKDRAWQVAITGIGGVGKSALAMAIAHEFRDKYDKLPEAERFEAIIWVSAKEEILTAYGREQADLPEQILRTLEDIYSAIAQALRREDITRALPGDQGLLVSKALKEQRTLLVMDNLESVADERIKPFLRKLPSPTKALITSREWLDVADVLTLTGMDYRDAKALIQEEASARDISIHRRKYRRIFNLTSGLPLPIKLAIARLSSGESFASVERWLGDNDGKLSEYCIRGQAELAQKRDPNTWKLLLVCSLFDRGAGASSKALGHITDLSIADLDSGLLQLRRLFLISRTGSDRYWSLPIIQRFAAHQLASVDFRAEVIDRWLAWLTNFAQNNGLDLELRVEHLEEFGIEYPNLLIAIRWCRDNQRWGTLYKLAEGTWAYPYLLGMFQDLDEILDAAKEDAEATNDEQKTGRIELQYGRLANIRHFTSSSVLKYIDIAEDIASRFKRYDDLGEALATRLSVLIYSQKFLEAEKVLKSFQQIAEDSENPHLKYLCAYRYSELETQKGNLVEAVKWLDEAEKWVLELGSQRYLGKILQWRGAIYTEMGEFELAEESLTRALDIYISWKGQRFIAYSRHQLAILHTANGVYTLARHYAHEAISLYQRLGLDRNVAEVEELLQKIELQADSTSV